MQNNRGSKAKPGQHYQFERLGYFETAPKDSTLPKLVFSLTVTLKDIFAKK